MPSLSDIFNPSFFMCLGILVLLTALIVVYFESKMREQNHKISSMLSLVSSLAEEQNNLRNEVFHIITGQNTINNLSSQHIVSGGSQNKKNDNDLINVSDDEDDDDDDEDDDSDSNDDSDDSDSNDDSDDDSDVEENEIIEIGGNDIKILKININKNNKDDDCCESNFNIDDLEELDNDNKDNIEDIDEDDDDEESSIDDEDSSINDNELLEETNIEDNLDDMKEISNFEEISSLDLKSIDFKQINILGLDKSSTDNEEYDYKKFSLNKLKSLVMEKGLMKDPSKMKKNELLKLLGV